MEERRRTAAGTNAADALALEISYRLDGGMSHEPIASQTISADDNDGRAPGGGDGRSRSWVGTDVHVAGNQSTDRRAAGAAVNKFADTPIFLKKTDFLGDPERRPRGSGRGISNVEGFKLLLLRSRRT